MFEKSFHSFKLTRLSRAQARNHFFRARAEPVLDFDISFEPEPSLDSIFQFALEPEHEPRLGSEMLGLDSTRARARYTLVQTRDKAWKCVDKKDCTARNHKVNDQYRNHCEYDTLKEDSENYTT